MVLPIGQWHLWIYCCAWKISDALVALAHSESTLTEIEKAIAFLDGQILQQVSPGQKQGEWTFQFDLQGILYTSPYDEDSDQWMLFGPHGWVLTSDAFGNLNRQIASSAD